MLVHHWSYSGVNWSSIMPVQFRSWSYTGLALQAWTYICVVLLVPYWPYLSHTGLGYLILALVLYGSKADLILVLQ